MTGHGGGDFYTMYYFVRKILGYEDGIENSLDVYEALDMCLPGLLAYKSILSGNSSIDIPDLRNKDQRDLYRNDTFCTDKKVAGDMYVYSHSSGEIKHPKEVYEKVYESYKKRKLGE